MNDKQQQPQLIPGLSTESGRTYRLLLICRPSPAIPSHIHTASYKHASSVCLSRFLVRLSYRSVVTSSTTNPVRLKKTSHHFPRPPTQLFIKRTVFDQAGYFRSLERLLVNLLNPPLLPVLPASSHPTSSQLPNTCIVSFRILCVVPFAPLR
ncbi:hypothetical protein VTK26DRAFT_9119 [Humicola hyalothermophila]